MIRFNLPTDGPSPRDRELDDTEWIALAIDLLDGLGKSIYEIVRQCAEAAGITKRISPHRIRHSAITALLDANNGNTRQAQSFSRHSSADILRKYDDNRQRLQGQATDLLGDLL